MQLTADYFALRPEERKLPNENKINDPELYHYAVFSDNVLACGVVVNSTVSNSKVNYDTVFGNYLTFYFLLLMIQLFCAFSFVECNS
jgi:hypothetical protein